MKSLTLLTWLSVGGFCVVAIMSLLLDACGPQYGLLLCLVPLLVGVIVAGYLGTRSLHNLDEFEDPWRVSLFGSFAPRGAFTSAGWRFRIYAGIAVVAGFLASGLLMAFCGY